MKWSRTDHDAADAVIGFLAKHQGTTLTRFEVITATGVTRQRLYAIGALLSAKIADQFPGYRYTLDSVGIGITSNSAGLTLDNVRSDTARMLAAETHVRRAAANFQGSTHPIGQAVSLFSTAVADMLGTANTHIRELSTKGEPE